jgi:hypothetical protein
MYPMADPQPDVSIGTCYRSAGRGAHARLRGALLRNGSREHCCGSRSLVATVRSRDHTGSMHSGLRAETVVLALPFRGRWRVENSPAHRVPSHGGPAFGSSYAIDFVNVDESGRSAPFTWRSTVAAEPPERFLGFGVPILSPVTGRVVAAHDQEPDHAGRRSQLVLLPYMLGQAKRAREGAAGLAGNHVVIALSNRGPFVLVAHLKRDTVQVRVGDEVSALDPIGRCGNSGNSTEPHVHVQVSDSTDWARSNGVPLAFRGADGDVWLPEESEVVRV